MTAYPDPNSRSATLHGLAERLIPDGVSRGTLLVDPYPIYVASGQGAWVTDVDARRYLDANNNYTSIIWGHADAQINDAVTEQLALGTAFAMATEAEVELAMLLCERVPSIERVRFCNSGTEAVMMAIKAARAFTGRSVIAKIEGSYHGAYDHIEVSLDADPERWGYRSEPTSVPYGAGTPESVLDETVVLPFNDAEVARELITRHGDSLAAIVLDTLPSRVGMPEPDPEFLAAISETAREVGALTILDEVISFRLGPAGNQGLLGFQPDLTTLAKIIGGGFPIGAVGGRVDVMNVFASIDDARPAVPAGGTFSANSISMVAGLTAMSRLDQAAFDRLADMGERTRQGIRNWFDHIGFEAQVTGAGSLFRVHPHGRPVRSYRDARHSPDEAAFMRSVHRHLLNREVYMTTYGMGCLSLAMTDNDLDHLVDAIGESIQATLDEVINA